MPLYEYACRQCEHTFEALVHVGVGVGVGESDAVVCPQCQAESPERLLSLPARPVSAEFQRTCQADPATPPCGPMCQRLK